MYVCSYIRYAATIQHEGLQLYGWLAVSESFIIASPNQLGGVFMEPTFLQTFDMHSPYSFAVLMILQKTYLLV